MIDFNRLDYCLLCGEKLDYSFKCCRKRFFLYIPVGHSSSNAVEIVFGNIRTIYYFNSKMLFLYNHKNNEHISSTINCEVVKALTAAVDAAEFVKILETYLAFQ